MKKHFKILSSLLVMIAMLVLPYFIFAQTATDQESMLGRLNKVAETGGYSITGNANLTSIVGLVIQAVLGLLGAIFVILMVYAGYTWMTASGNEPKIEKARNMIQTAIIGLIIVIGSWAIWAFIFSNFIGG